MESFTDPSWGEQDFLINKSINLFFQINKFLLSIYYMPDTFHVLSYLNISKKKKKPKSLWYNYF